MLPESQGLVRQTIHWVGDDAELEAVCARWKSCSMLALDTEFMRSRTYYPLAGLIQINDGEQNCLIDPTTIDDFFPLIDILDDDKILKVLHSSSEDLEVFQHGLGCLPRHILDTQIAAAIAGYDFSLGYANLVKQVLGHELPKSETRSDWLQRPLSNAQLQYAAVDVEYLYVVAERLIAKLNQSSRLSWAMEDSAALLRNYFENQDPDKSFLRLKSAWKLDSRRLAILQGVSRWREDKAQEKNVPRNRIVKENAMMTIAQTAPSELRQLKNIEGFSERMIRSNGEKILAIVAQALALPESALPVKMPAPLNAVERKLLEEMKTEIVSRAKELSIPAEILARKKDIEYIIVNLRHRLFSLPPSLTGWRRSLVGEQLLNIAKTHSDEG